MEVALFFFGAFGALLTVYLAKQEVIPEFRPLFDTSDKEIEAREHREHNKRTERFIDDVQATLRNEQLSPELAARLTTVLNASQAELNAERTRLETLEREIARGQILSRSLGFIFYIGLGGVFGSLLAGRVEVVGLSGDLPNFIESMVIGATWTSYLSTIGFSAGQKRADDRLVAGLKASAGRFDAVKKELTEMIAQEVTKAQKADKAAQPAYANALAAMVGEKLDLAATEVQKDLNLTRQMVQRDIKGIL